MAGEGKKKKLVVVGGGVAGSAVAYSLQQVLDVTIVDPKDYFEIPWAELRSMVEPTFASRSLIKHEDYLVHGKLIQSTAIGVTENKVMTADGNSADYDYLVVATGHAYTTPKSRYERLEEFKQESQRIKAAKSILIVGGGPTGVELAGEIAMDFPDKKVTIVHRGPRLLEFMGTKASEKAMGWLKSKEVDILLDQSVDLNSVSENEYTTSAGKKIRADVHFLCTGKPQGSSWLHNSILKDSLDASGKLKVDEYLRVKGLPNVFAIGDITDVPELKQGYIAQQHAALVAKNLKLILKGAMEKKLGKYKPGPVMAIVSLGRKQGLGQFPFGTLIGWFPGMIKSKDLFVGSTRKALGLEGDTNKHVQSGTSKSGHVQKDITKITVVILVALAAYFVTSSVFCE